MEQTFNNVSLWQNCDKPTQCPPYPVQIYACNLFCLLIRSACHLSWHKVSFLHITCLCLPLNQWHPMPKVFVNIWTTSCSINLTCTVLTCSYINIHQYTGLCKMQASILYASLHKSITKSLSNNLRLGLQGETYKNGKYEKRVYKGLYQSIPISNDKGLVREEISEGIIRCPIWVVGE